MAVRLTVIKFTLDYSTRNQHKEVVVSSNERSTKVKRSPYHAGKGRALRLYFALFSRLGFDPISEYLL